MKDYTNKQMFEAMKSYFNGEDIEFTVGDFVEFCDEKIKALDERAAKAKARAAEKKAEPDALTDVVADVLTDEFMSIADLAELACQVDPEASVGKITYRLGKLVETGVAEKGQVAVEGKDGKKSNRVGYRRKVESVDAE